MRAAGWLVDAREKFSLLQRWPYFYFFYISAQRRLCFPFVGLFAGLLQKLRNQFPPKLSGGMGPGPEPGFFSSSLSFLLFYDK